MWVFGETRSRCTLPPTSLAVSVRSPVKRGRSPPGGLLGPAVTPRSRRRPGRRSLGHRHKQETAGSLPPRRGGPRARCRQPLGLGSLPRCRVTQAWPPRCLRGEGTQLSTRNTGLHRAKSCSKPSSPTCRKSVCPAEELPFEDASVDLLTSFTAAHWFDIEKFMREANRVVKPGGCMVISTYTVDMSLCYGNCSEKLTKIFRESWDLLLKYSHNRIKLVLENYKDIFEALPFPDKKRITDIFDKIPMTVAGVVGYLESASPYQAFMKNDPKAAKSLLQETEKS
ncbi:uncharacterized protein LOC128143884 isoform X1 [Harpia harpyja]|uniref:uncharacterized protein LOC128143884 isoform X1 n=1 Tax=Harpia harpyja TaxID=202280 RepID=UPI0022B1E8F7|nr:uncharacterized protein LOC128143884 isoform X1 [Harpia harpyja]